MRYAFATLLGVLVTLALFQLMFLLLSNSGKDIRRIERDGGLALLELSRSIEPQAEKRLTEPGPRTLTERPRQPAESGSSSPTASIDRSPPEFRKPSPDIPAPEKTVLDVKRLLELPLASFEKPETPVPLPAKSPSVRTKPELGTPAADAVEKGEPAPGAEEISPRLGALGSAEPGPLDVGELGQDQAIPLLRLEPSYPRKAAMAGQEGWVKVAFTITEEGKVIEAVVTDSRPRRVFDRSALRAIRKWRFRPKVVDGRPVKSQATQLIEFKLSGE